MTIVSFLFTFVYPLNSCSYFANYYGKMKLAFDVATSKRHVCCQFKVAFWEMHDFVVPMLFSIANLIFSNKK